MIEFEKFSLANGLRVIVHEDHSTPLAAVNILYNVGARDEDPQRTGFAHLFEHLMFGGSVNIPNYDDPLQRAGGDNNAFTTNDITNYYLTLPANNLELAFWLESDRMLSLAFSEKSLEVQRNVVIEEFKQRYFNQPYGDVWLLLRPLAYKVHPYQWATIGKNIAHIEEASLDDVKNFFFSHYAPGNAIMVITGNVKVDEVKKHSEKWFGPIDHKIDYKRNLPIEPPQTEARKLTVKKTVPYDSIYKTFHCCSRLDQDFYSTDLLTDILSRGKSSRLFNSLVKDKKLFSEINCYQTSDLDKGLVVVEGKLVKGVKMDDAENAIEEELELVRTKTVEENELTKVKNKIESTVKYAEMDITNKAMNIAYSELMGDAALVNKEIDLYSKVNSFELMQRSKEIFRLENSSTLYYLSEN